MTARSPAAIAEQAAIVTSRAAERAGVEIRLVDDLPGLDEVCGLLDRIWRPEPTNPLLTTEFARALSHSGNYIAGAFDGADLVGACVGFFAAPPGEALHSHVAGVAEPALGRHVGWALKLHQRAWALARGLREITWTFDPLVRRNAHFNLVKLAARPREYLVDFYGDIPDSVNAGQGSDRLLLAWDLASPDVVAAGEGRQATPSVVGATRAISALGTDRPVIAAEPEWRSARIVTIQLPADITALRRDNPGAAREWRRAVRDVLGALLHDGWQVTGFSRTEGYVVERTAQ
jgi:predicted GNAT superfamily acetyltransferase